MLRLLKGRKAQSTAEYAILIGLIVAVVVAMQTYVKRGIQGRLHDASNDFYDAVSGDANWGDVSQTPVTPLAGKQYEIETLSSQSTQNVLEDTQGYDMTEEGTVTRSSSGQTQQAVGDSQTQDY